MNSLILLSLILIIVLLILCLRGCLQRSKVENQQQIIDQDNVKFKLHYSETRQQLILDSAAEGIITIDEKGTIQVFNAAAQVLFGYTAEEVLGQNVAIIVPEPHKSVHDQYLNHYLDTGIAKIIGGGGCEVQGMHKDGHVFPMYLSLSEAKVGSESIFTGICHDMTKQKETDDMLRKLSAAVEQSPASVVITDPQGNIEYVNTKFTEITGYQPEEVIGQNPRLLKTDETSLEAYEMLWKTILSGEEWHGEFKNISKKGETYWEAASISPIKGEEGVISHFLAVKENISERKKAEAALCQSKEEAEQARQQAELANKAKSEFLANMSHEIRTPLNGILGMTHLALQSTLTEKQRNYIDKIYISSQTLLSIINDILDFSKVEAGKLEIEAIDFELDQVLNNLYNLVGLKAQQKGLEFMFNVAPEVPYSLVGDPLRLGQILLNLCNNAVKFTEDGEVIISIELEQANDQQVTLKFCVKDTGIGLSKQEINHLFKAFTQADGSTTRKYGGTGLGLSISKHLVKLMGGQLSVNSESGKGSCFEFTTLLGLRPQPHKMWNCAPLELKNLKVLVVDDCETSREIIRRQLESLSFAVFEADSGKSAIDMLNEAARYEPFQLVIMDWQMPDMNGIETIQQLKTLNIQPEIPTIMMMSAYRMDEVMSKARNIGINTFLSKPVNRSLFFNAIMAVFHHDTHTDLEPSRKGEIKGFDALKGVQVLLVEDNEINQEVAKELLLSVGMSVDIACDGKKALNQLDVQAYDIILMDLQMPVMDGYQATRLIRQDPRFSDLPIVAMTANALTGDREKCIKAGMNDHVGKPIMPKQLFTTVTKALGVAAIELSDHEILGSGRGQSQALSAEEKTTLSLLKSFDVPLALERVDQKVNVYLKLLSKFRNNFEHSIEQLQSMQAQSDWAGAEYLVHKLAGVAGNIAADSLFQAARQLDESLKTRQEDIPQELVSELEKYLSQVLSEIKQMESLSLTADPSQEEFQNKTLTIKDALSADLTRLLVELKGFLEEDDANATKTLKNLQHPLQRLGFQEDWGQLQKLISQYNFEDALIILEQLNTSLKQEDKE